MPGRASLRLGGHAQQGFQINRRHDFPTSYRHTPQTMSDSGHRRQKGVDTNAEVSPRLFETEVRENLRATTGVRTNLRSPRGKLSNSIAAAIRENLRGKTLDQFS
jgi:hypothetical protein